MDRLVGWIGGEAGGTIDAKAVPKTGCAAGHKKRRAILWSRAKPRARTGTTYACKPYYAEARGRSFCAVAPNNRTEDALA